MAKERCYLVRVSGLAVDVTPGNTLSSKSRRFIDISWHHHSTPLDLGEKGPGTILTILTDLIPFFTILTNLIPSIMTLCGRFAHKMPRAVSAAFDSSFQTLQFLY